MASSRTGQFYPSHAALFTDPASPILRLFNVQHLVGRFDLFEPSRVIPNLPPFHAEEVAAMTELAVAHPRWPVWRYRDNRPLAWTAARLFRARSAEEAIVSAASLASLNAAIFSEEEEELTLRQPPPAVASATWRDARLLRVALASPTTEETPLFVSVASMRGWRARATPSGEPLRGFVANGFGLGALLPPGVAEVEFRYEPASFLRGSLCSAAGLLLLAALWFRAAAVGERRWAQAKSAIGAAKPADGEFG
jgi:hypothetical protein